MQLFSNNLLSTKSNIFCKLKKIFITLSLLAILLHTNISTLKKTSVINNTALNPIWEFEDKGFFLKIKQYILSTHYF